MAGGWVSWLHATGLFYVNDSASCFTTHGDSLTFIPSLDYHTVSVNCPDEFSTDSQALMWWCVIVSLAYYHFTHTSRTHEHTAACGVLRVAFSVLRPKHSFASHTEINIEKYKYITYLKSQYRGSPIGQLIRILERHTAKSMTCILELPLDQSITYVSQCLSSVTGI